MKTASFLIALALIGSVRVADAQVQRTDTYGQSWNAGRSSVALSGILHTRGPHARVSVNRPLERVAVRTVGGAVFIRRISVEFANGNVANYQVHTRVRPGEIKAIDVRGRRVARVEVVTDPRSVGTYQVLGTPSFRRPGPPVGWR